MPRYLSLFLMLFALSACDKPKVRHVTRSFYYWKSIFDLSPSESQMMDSLHVEKLYIKFFDVTWHDINQAIPAAQLKVKHLPDRHIQIVPCVFITNETILQLKDVATAELLAFKISKKIGQIQKASGLPTPCEIQIDCDWNETSRDKYFALLSTLRKIRSNVSATIRLHQILYKDKTGIPPVDRGTLMLYNMSAVGNLTTSNSIYDADETEKYLSEKTSYPLKLDVALPLFSWGVVFKDKKFKGIINNLNTEVVRKNLTFFRKTDVDNFYICEMDTVFQGNYFRTGDMLRIEEVNVKDLEHAAASVNALIKTDSVVTVSLYHLDPAILNRYTYEQINTIYTSFDY